LRGFGGIDQAKHLIERAFAGEGEAGRCRNGGVEEEDDGVDGFDQGWEGSDAVGSGFTNAGEWADDGRIAAGAGIAEGKRRVGVAERVVDGVVEER
jgi:hypothetical protein